MKVIKNTKKIVCDMPGCHQNADFFIKKSEEVSDGESLKLCKQCAKETYQSFKSWRYYIILILSVKWIFKYFTVDNDCKQCV